MMVWAKNVFNAFYITNRNFSFYIERDTTVFRIGDGFRMLRQTQAVPASRNTVRQTPLQLHGLRQTRRHRHVASIVKSVTTP
jgi:hypothetical protein